MGVQGYRAVLASRDVRRTLVLSFVMRVPMWASSIVLTLHVVTHLDRSYGAAGLLVAVATVALSASAPWRGRRLDRVGLRRTVAPSLGVLVVCWSVAPFVDYWYLLVLAGVAGLFVVPSFSIVRQVLMHAVPENQRTTALSIDSVAVELSFMAGPPIGVLLATYLPTSWALLACEFAVVLGGALLWIANPTLRAEEPKTESPTGHTGHWATPRVVVILLIALVATLVLTGTEVGTVAALRDMGHQSWIGWQLAVWGLGSAAGGLLYGALNRSLPLPLLLALLAGTTLPVALAREPVLLAGLLFVTGFFCAPTITAGVDALSRAVSERVRGEALGWHGSAMTAGSAVGAPIAGFTIDQAGWRGGFVIVGVVGLALAVVGAVSLREKAGPGRVTLPLATDPTGVPDATASALPPVEPGATRVP